MVMFFSLLALCEENPPVISGSPAVVTRVEISDQSNDTANRNHNEFMFRGERDTSSATEACGCLHK